MKQTFYISGLHCPSCEILIEKKLLKQKGVKKADVQLNKNILLVEFDSEITNINSKFLNNLFLSDSYHFSVKPFKSHATPDSCPIETKTENDPYLPWLIGLLFIIGFIYLNQTGFSSLVSVNSQSSLPLFFLFGLLAGFSSCAALVGGIILSLSKQWLSVYSEKDSTFKKTQPHLLFNVGRVLGYAVLGGVLGMVGNVFSLSPLFTATLVIGVSVLMVLLGLQMIGVKSLKSFQLRLPKSLTGKMADESNFQGRFGPLLMGALTFFLPCGFTITAQALALASGNPIQGALIMGMFAVGTVPGLLAIGLSSVKFHSNPKSSKQFSLIAGMLVLFFAAFNINAQLSVLGVSNINDLISNSSTAQSVPSIGELPPMVNGKQVVKIDASGSKYSPSRITMRANTPTRWEISDAGFSGCTNAIISRGLFEGQIDLIKGGVAAKEFTSPKPGVYKFSCWMGMVSGTVEVVDSSGSVGAAANAAPVESGAQGCGCGGGGGGTCGGGR